MLRHDLQPRRPAALSALMRTSRSPTHQSATPSYGMPPQQGSHANGMGRAKRALYQGLGRNTGGLRGLRRLPKPKRASSYRLPKIPQTSPVCKHLRKKSRTLKNRPNGRAAFWPIKGELLARGKELYDANCGSCHGTPIHRGARHLADANQGGRHRPERWSTMPSACRPGLLAGSPMPPPPLGATPGQPGQDPRHPRQTRW